MEGQDHIRQAALLLRGGRLRETSVAVRTLALARLRYKIPIAKPDSTREKRICRFSPHTSFALTPLTYSHISSHLTRGGPRRNGPTQATTVVVHHTQSQQSSIDLMRVSGRMGAADEIDGDVARRQCVDRLR